MKKFKGVSIVSIVIIIFIIYLFFNLETISCEEYGKEFSKKEFHMIILSKKKDGRNVIFEGENYLKGSKEVFNEIGFWDVYNQAILGDSIEKARGTTLLKLHQKNDIKEFKYECNGQEVVIK